MKRLIIRGHMRSGTTILFRILSSLKDIHITHELCLYDRLFETNDKSKNLNKFIKMLYDPPRTNGNNNEFSKINMKKLEKTLRNYDKENPDWNQKDMIEKIEDFIFSKDCKIIGDKDPHWNRYNELEELKKIEIKPKIIYTYRDGRDVLASRYRRFIDYLPEERESWALERPELGQDFWVDNITEFLNYYIKNDYYEILPHRFEDLLFNREKACERIANFIDIDKEELLKVVNNLIVSPEKSHHNYYKKVFSNWESVTSDKFKQSLKILGYIK